MAASSAPSRIRSRSRRGGPAISPTRSTRSTTSSNTADSKRTAAEPTAGSATRCSVLSPEARRAATTPPQTRRFPTPMATRWTTAGSTTSGPPSCTKWPLRLGAPTTPRSTSTTSAACPSSAPASSPRRTWWPSPTATARAATSPAPSPPEPSPSPSTTAPSTSTTGTGS